MNSFSLLIIGNLIGVDRVDADTYSGYCNKDAEQRLTFTRRAVFECCSIVKLTMNDGDHPLDSCLFDLTPDDDVYHLRQVSATSVAPSTPSRVTIGQQGYMASDDNEFTWCIVDQRYTGEDFLIDQQVSPRVDCNYTTVIPDESITSAHCLEKYEASQWAKQPLTTNSALGPSQYRPLDVSKQDNLDLKNRFDIEFGCMDLKCCRLFLDEEESVKSFNVKLLVDGILNKGFTSFNPIETDFLYNPKSDAQETIISNETLGNITMEIENNPYWIEKAYLAVNTVDLNILRRFYQMISLADNDDAIMMSKTLSNITLVTVNEDASGKFWCTTSFNSLSCQRESTYDFDRPSCPEFKKQSIQCADIDTEKTLVTKTTTTTTTASTTSTTPAPQLILSDNYRNYLIIGGVVVFVIIVSIIVVKIRQAKTNDKKNKRDFW